MRKIIACLVFGIFFLVGCDSEILFSGLPESEANEIVAVLLSENLVADKVADKKSGTYQVFTTHSSFSDAVSVLQNLGLPRERIERIDGVNEENGVVWSPIEERARLNYAISHELSRSISHIEGVILARVHLALPMQTENAKMIETTSVSVFVKHDANVDLAPSVGKIKSLIVAGLDNLTSDDITVELFPANINKTLRASDYDTSNIRRTSASRNSPSVLETVLIVVLVSIVGYVLVWNFRAGIFPTTKED